MTKGQTNPLTEIMTVAEELAMAALADLYDDFGIPLYTADPGRGKFTWPEDPERVTPEGMQQLISIWGQQTVERWLMETAARKAEEEE